MDPNRTTAAGTFVSAALVDTYVCHESVNRATGEEESRTHTAHFSLRKVSKVLWVGGVFSSILNTKSDQGEICLPNNSILE